MSYNMYLDDIRQPKTPVFHVICRSSKEAIKYMKKNGCPSMISFDHDLGGDDSAMVLIDWMIKVDLDKFGDLIPVDFTWNVHSANPVGTENINGRLTPYFKGKVEYFEREEKLRKIVEEIEGS
jgi:hypothetical protein